MSRKSNKHVWSLGDDQLSTRMCMCTYLCLPLSLSPSVPLSLCPSVPLSLCPSVPPSVCLPLLLPASIHLSLTISAHEVSS